MTTVTIVDVAREAGVSYSTVSRVINNNVHVLPETRERVLNAMMRLGYVVNQQARSLRGGRSQVIGVLVHDVGNDYVGAIIRGIDAELAAQQYDLMLYTTHRRKTKESAYVATITRGMADGLLLVLPTNAREYLETLHHQQFPHVLIDYQHVESALTSTVQSTNYRGAYDATTYLIGLGHRRIAYIIGSPEMQCSLDRLEGFRAALADAGLPEDPDLIFSGDFFRPQGYAAASHFLSLEKPPTAIFAANDISAFGVMDGVSQHGLRVPEDISVLGFDDLVEAGHVHPGLTTVRQPLEEMGRTAARLLFRRLNNPDLPSVRVEMPTELVIRESCAPVSQHVGIAPDQTRRY